MPIRLFSLISILFLFSSPALARSTPSESSQARSFPVPPVRARAAVAMDADTGQVLAAYNAHLHLHIASTTKVMTAVLALEMGDLNDRVTVPSAAFDYEWDATVMGLRPGQVVTLRDLLYGLMLPSGADAANTIAIHYGGSEAHWVALMNQKAAELGMRDTHYANAHGLDAPNQYSSAYDLALLGVYASEMPDLIKITSAKSYSWNGHTLQNLNHVINWYPGADGLKPGFTNAAGMCQLLAAHRHGRHVVAAIVNTPDMVIDARDLLNFGFHDFSWIQSALPGDSPALDLGGRDAAGSYVYFPASGHYIRDTFWKPFMAGGGLGSLGFPRTEPLKEGTRWVQYFQNGALAADAHGHVTRLTLGLTPLPGVTATPTATPIRIPREGTVVVGASPRPTSTRPAQRATPTPPPPAPTSTPGGITPQVANAFAAYHRAHQGLLGSPIGPAVTVKGYVVQIFRYSALAGKGRSVWLLPLGDRLLEARHYLPDHPGNAYPGSFAPKSVLTALHWLSGR